MSIGLCDAGVAYFKLFNSQILFEDCFRGASELLKTCSFTRVACVLIEIIDLVLDSTLGLICDTKSCASILGVFCKARVWFSNK